MSFLRIILLAAAILSVCRAGAEEPPSHATNVVAGFELRDQFDQPQKLAFPATNVTVLIVTDRKGSPQVAAWLAALESAHRNVVVLGLADVGGAPGFVHGKIRRQFQEDYRQPVMLDWSGKISARIGYQPGIANVLVIGRDGIIRARIVGKADEANRDLALKAMARAWNP